MDNCDGEVMAATDAVFPITSSTTITWIYEDAAGNAVVQTQEITCPLGAQNNTLEVSIFPNPAGNYLEVRSAFESPIHILDLNGRFLLETTTNTRVNITALRSGMYLVQLPGGRLLKVVKK